MAQGELQCYGRGVCSNAACQCDAGWFGNRCEFPQPCDTIEFDARSGGFQDVRVWSSKFEILKDENNDMLTTYGRPVYIGMDGTDFIVFTGRRWMASHFGLINNGPERTYGDSHASISLYFEGNFHAYWTGFEYSFATEPLDIQAEVNSAVPAGLIWFRSLPKSEEHPLDVQNVDRTIGHLNSAFICNSCGDKNPCQHGGVCIETVCKCAIGSEGSLCEVCLF